MRFALALLLMSAASFAADSARTIIVVRHAERASGGMGPDVPLSEAGKCRATILAKMLVDSKIASIYTSDVARTQQTADPLAKRLGVKLEALPGKDVAGLVERLKAGQGNALVVGHSNTVPEVVNGLGAGPAAAMPDEEFDRMYVVTLAGGHAYAAVLRYPACPATP